MDYPWIRMKSGVCEIVVIVDKIAIGAAWSRFKRRVRLLRHHIANALLFLVGYRLLEASCDGCQKFRVHLNIKDISNTTTKALVPYRREDSKKGWAIRLKTEDGNIVAGEDGNQILYKDKGIMFWEPVRGQTQ